MLFGNDWTKMEDESVGIKVVKNGPGPYDVSGDGKLFIRRNEN